MKKVTTLVPLELADFLQERSFFTIKLGIRLEYAISDFVSDQGQKDGYPTYYTDFEPYTPSHPFRASIALGINFGLGGIAKSVCGQRRYIFGTAYR